MFEPIQMYDGPFNVKKLIRDRIQNEGQEDGFFICDVSDIIRKYENWKILLPRVDSHYAFKCNNAKVVIKTLAALGMGFDCASKEEIQAALSLGVNPDKIIFANPTKKTSDIRFAKKVGVEKMTFDNEAELQKISQFYPEAKTVIRIIYDDPTARYILGKKYGCNARTDAKKLLILAKSLSVDVVGVAFHIGSDMKDISTYFKAIQEARYVFDLAETLGYEFNLLDIGGGFPGSKNTSIVKTANLINKALDTFFPDDSVKIISEPGRYYVNSAFTLATNIHSLSTKEISKNGETTKVNMYYVDVGVYGSLIPIFFGESFTPSVLNATPGENLYPSIVWGPTCDCCDKICEHLLPEMEVGDWMYFENAGAYTLSRTCEFNGFTKPDIYYLISRDDAWLFSKNIGKSNLKSSDNCFDSYLLII